MTCLSCGRDELVPLRRYVTHTRYGNAIFAKSWLLECSRCELVQVAPAPRADTLAKYYNTEYRRTGYAGSDVAELGRFPKDNLFYYNRGESIAKLIREYLSAKAPTMLDVGAGYGHVLESLGRRYPESIRVAIEHSDPCIRFLRAAGVETHSEPIEDSLTAIGRRLDLVVMSHVLEHLLDPRRVLSQLQDALEPGGLLYLEVPHVLRDPPSGYPDHVWAPRFDEPHITFFSIRTLRALVESIGLELQVCDTAGPRYRYISAWRYRTATPRWLLQGLLPGRVFHWLRRNALSLPLRVKEREESFFDYGGDRIWIRGVWRKPGVSTRVPSEIGAPKDR